MATATVAGLALVLTAACGSDSGDGSAGAGGTATTGPSLTVPADVEDLTGQAEVEIGVVDNDFEPAAFRVDPRTEIVFVNRGENKHNVTPSVEGSFEGLSDDELDVGARASVTIDDAGTYHYYCTLHGTPTRGQNGVIIVGDG
jgi:plastocyanin